jgi:hypothetical protein
MEVIVGEYYYHKHMFQRFEVLAIDGNFVWLKGEEHYLTTTISELQKEKAPLPLPDNGVD